MHINCILTRSFRRFFLFFNFISSVIFPRAVLRKCSWYFLAVPEQNKKGFNFITGFKLTMYLVKYVLRGDFQNNLIYASSLCSQESLYKQIFAPLPAVQKSGKRIISLQRSDITGDGTFLPATSIFEQSRFSPKGCDVVAMAVEAKASAQLRYLVSSSLFGSCFCWRQSATKPSPCSEDLGCFDGEE